MSQQELLIRVIQALDQAEIQYMITGSVASSLQGEPRSTHDIDLVILLEKSRVNKLIEALLPQKGFYLNQESILDAIDGESMFNLIDLREGDKVDFWILTNEPFDQSRFSRRYREEFMGISMRVSTPEDTILAKLKWAKLSGGSEKQFIDALRVYEVQYGNLDMSYLENWAGQLGLEALWTRLNDEAETE